MTQEEKELLIKDLSARLPYGVKIKIGEHSDYKLIGITITDEYPIKVEVIENGVPYKIEVSPDIIKPYLRPMSSMTEEEEKEYAKIVVKSQDCSYENNESATTIVNDWYLSKGFDVRGLIPKVLALEALEGMYK